LYTLLVVLVFLISKVYLVLPFGVDTRGMTESFLITAPVALFFIWIEVWAEMFTASAAINIRSVFFILNLKKPRRIVAAGPLLKCVI
jgi:hypothetical protein